MRALVLFMAASALFAQTWQPQVTNAKLQQRAYSGDLGAEIRAASPAWFGYAVKSVRSDNQSCCWNGSNGCWLEDEKQHGWPAAKSGRPIPLEGSDAIAILFRVENNTIEKIRAFPLSCPLDAGGLPFVWITGVSAQASLGYLQKLAAAGPEDHIADGANLRHRTARRAGSR